jgi:superfamily I DNA/RNA helicase
MARKSMKSAQDMRRLIYTATTRAKKSLTIMDTR